ncbi:Fanconi anemia group M protein isoform X3 [Micropterus dolomieu]|uniref:Fanconi anemia group M protein isoform X2 n=1 Tax=Micropterus dolomieu TaxID=147949 RepID=UPI001E8D9CE4|nr:Fanconi anemia group M protein isoform X2 [Micropterus dolomieu]XP_045918057.1 Fanconi anemia group M protein isoform X3 [Micropterus dolomieu]
MKMSSGSNQRTLFQTWGAPVSQNKVVQPKKDVKKAAGRHKTTPSNTAQVAPTHPARSPLWTEIGQRSTSENPVRKEDFNPADEDDDDDLMVVAVYEAERSLQLDNANSFQVCQYANPEGTESTALSPIPSGEQTYPDFPGFDSSSAKVWIYPTNYPIREYQLKISEVALFQNTLVCLPTGLGKTFIASVVMYNFYRWYPSGKIVFMAPTKPLVAQQIEACYKVMGIPQAHMAELTGSTAAKQRQEVWRTKRVFFLTPQVMVNDLSRQTCPAQHVKCVVIDEAHKALGNHAYCQVIRQLGGQTVQFRILALSATPGGDTKSVQSVISNLLISHIELRSDESPDIKAHSHQRSVDKVVVPLGETLSAHQARYLQVLEKFMSRLVQNRVMAHKDLRTLSKYQLILARDQFRKNPPPNIKGPQQGMLEGDFALCISLYHGYELLMQMGLRSLFFYIQGIMDGSREMSRARNELQRTSTFMDLYHEMETMFVKPSAGLDEPFFYSHPKLQKLEEVVLQHFRLWAESSANNNASGPQEVSTRVMIFSSFRESVQEIAAMLNRHAPLIRVMTFMGQASAGKGVKGFTQKEQLEVVCRFRQGGFNTLVSTCVGEEGLDIGEVDLIVCFDAQKNPIRLVQRMGRTGRKRQGRIVVILAEGREERTYNQSQSNKRSVHKSIIGNKSGFHMYPNSPRMLPEGVKPTLHKMHITCGQFDHRESSRRSIRGRLSHSEGRASLIHPQNLIRQGSATSDGFLSRAEYSLWSSTMKLQEDEAHPILKQSHFMSLPSDQPPQEDVSKSGPPPRELSLWEWRHWQHKAFPTSAVDHSLRCHHFIKVMELIDGMREENEGECRYEQELLPYLHKADGHVRNRQKKQKGTKTCTKTSDNTPKQSHSTLSDLEFIDEEAERENTRKTSSVSTLAVTKQRLPVEHDTEAPYDNITDSPGPEPIYSLPLHNECPETDMDEDCAIVYEDVIKSEPVNLDNISHLTAKIDEDENVELQAMFYLPTWGSLPSPPSAILPPDGDQSLKVILANVAELLSRSPPALTEDVEANVAAPSLSPLPQRPHQPFQVSFTLDVDDDDDDDEVMMSDADNDAPRAHSDEPPVGIEDSKIYHDRPHQELQTVSRGSIAADSPTWDEVFGEEELNDNHEIRDNSKETDDEVYKEERVGKKSKNDSEEKESCWDDTRNGEMPDLRDCGVKDDRGCQMDESIDLFGDDEAFLQMTIPNISTPGVTPRTSPSAGDIASSTKNMLNTSRIHTPANPCSTTYAAEGAHRLNTAHTGDLAHTPHAKLITQDTNTHNATSNNTHTAAARKPVTDNLIAISAHCKSPTMQQNSESFDSSHDIFSVNFDLGYSLEDSEEEEVEDVPAPCMLTSLQPKKQAVSDASTPYNSFHRQRMPLQFSEHTLSTPQMLSEHRGRETSSLLGGALPSPIASPAARRMLVPGTAGPHTPSLLSSLKRRRLEGRTAKAEGVSGVENSSRQESVCVAGSSPHPVECSSDSEDDVVLHKRRHHNNPLWSPEMSKISSDVDSPVVVNRRRAAALNTSDEMEGEAVSDDDFQNESVFTRRNLAHGAERQPVQQRKAKHTVCRPGRQFLDEEAEQEEDEEGADVSSDEDDGEDLDRSLEGFVVDNTHFSQGLNDSEMHGVYLKSVRSPAIQGKFKMSYRNHHNMDIFSQVPEMDETYAEDSFVVGSEVEEVEELKSSEEEAEDIELMPEDSYVDGKRQYATRRRVFLHKVRARARAGSKTAAEAPKEQRAGMKTKHARVIRVCDSSEEETEEVCKKRSVTTEEGVAAPLWPKAVQLEPSRPWQQQKPPSSSSSTIASKVSLLSKAQRRSGADDQQNERCCQRLENQHLLSDELDFLEPELLLSSKKQPQTLPATSSEPQKPSAQGSSVNESPAASGPVCILVDSRCISSGVELMASLRQRHAAIVHVCSLDGNYFIVSNRMAVERHGQSDLATMQNRKRLAERVNSLQGLFERVCLIVEKDRTKPGEASRHFQRTRYYDSTLIALVHTGVRLLWSDGAEQSAGLLADLARLEQRKGQGIGIPLEVKGQHRQQALQLYLSLPSVSYVHALNMSHNFRSIAQLMNSSIEAIQKGGCMSRSRAEEIYRFLRYSCDSLLMNTSKPGKNS